MLYDEGTAAGAAIYQERGPVNASGAILIDTNAVAHFLASIVDQNTPTNVAGSVIDQGYNLSSDATPPFSAAGSLNNIDPGLGGPVTTPGSTMTLALRPGAPALDAIPIGISTAESDQRGVPRPIGPGSDIGAFEYLPPPVVEWRNGQLQVERVLAPDKDYRVEATADLGNWSFLSAEHSDARGRVVFRDPDSPGLRYRFYRMHE